MESLINNYPNIVSDFSQFIHFSFNKILKHFNQKINKFKVEYYFLVSINKYLFIKDEKNNTNMIDEIIDIINYIKEKNSSAKIKIFRYNKYVKEIMKIKKEEEKIDKKKLIENIIKELENNTETQTDIILSLSNLYNKLEKYLIKGKYEKSKIMKIILINNDKYLKYNENIYEEKNLKNILNEFIHDKSIYFGVEFNSWNNQIFNKENILQGNDLIKRAENLNLELYEKWQDINSNEDINEGIKKLDELLIFLKNVLNSIFFIKTKLKNCKNNKEKENYSQQIIEYVTSENLNNIKDSLLSSDINELYLEELNNYKKKINDIEMNNFINDEMNIKKETKNCININNLSKYLIKQKEYIFQYLDILLNTKSFIDSIIKQIFKQTKDIITNNYNKDNSKMEEESEDD